MKRPPLVEVEWVDSVATVGWCDKADQQRWINGKIQLFTAGYLLSSTKREVTIGTSFNTDAGQVSGMFQIPRSCVKKLRKLK